MVPTVANLYWPICGHSSETKSNGTHYWLCGVHYWQHSYMLSSGSIWVINIKMGQNPFQTGFVLLVMLFLLFFGDELSLPPYTCLGK